MLGFQKGAFSLELLLFLLLLVVVVVRVVAAVVAAVVVVVRRAVAQLVEVSFEFLIDIILPVAL